jgi:hypothetical protein
MPAIGFGQTYSNGVKYIKVNRYDSGGLDRSDYLGQLQSLTLTYPDRSAIEYPITTIQEQANFYLYGITPGYNTSSRGDILNYTLTANSIQPAGTAIPTTYGSFLNLGLPSCSILTTGSGIYVEPTILSSGYIAWGTTMTPNVNLLASASFTVTNTTGADIGVQFYISNGVAGALYVLASSSTNILGGATVPIALNFTVPALSVEPLISSSLYFFGIHADGAGCQLNTGTVNLYLNQSTATFNGSSSLTIFDPDALNFDYNDYNPLLDNAETPQYSTTWMDVDYSQNPLVPINFGLIISGTADRAFVQDSNYSSKAWSNLRYNGSRTNSFRNI